MHLYRRLARSEERVVLPSLGAVPSGTRHALARQQGCFFNYSHKGKERRKRRLQISSARPLELSSSRLACLGASDVEHRRKRGREQLRFLNQPGRKGPSHAMTNQFGPSFSTLKSRRTYVPHSFEGITTLLSLKILHCVCASASSLMARAPFASRRNRRST